MLLYNQIKSGKCSEMAAVAAYYFRLRMRGQYATMYMGTVSSPGDHVFVLLSVDGTPPQGENISLMARNQGSDNFWVIDPWANVACRARDYPSRLLTKFSMWSVQNKLARGGGSRQYKWLPQSRPRSVHHSLSRFPAILETFRCFCFPITCVRNLYMRNRHCLTSPSNGSIIRGAIASREVCPYPMSKYLDPRFLAEGHN